MTRNDPSRVVRHVLTKAMGDAAYRQALLESPDDVMKFEFARSGVPVPDIQFDAVEETEKNWVVRVPVSKSEQREQKALATLFEYVKSADAAELDRFVRAPKQKLQELLGIRLEDDMDIAVHIEEPGQRILVIPRDEFGAINPGSGPLQTAAKIKLCPKGHTIRACPKGKTVDIDLCPADCTFTSNCGCTISCTENMDTGDFPTIQLVARSSAAPLQDPVKRMSDLLDE